MATLDGCAMRRITAAVVMLTGLVVTGLAEAQDRPAFPS